MPNGRRGFGTKERSNEMAPSITPQQLEEVIVGGNVTEANEICNELGKYYAEGQEREKMSSSQIRNVLDRLQRMGGYSPDKLQLLRPLLAYAAGRHGGKVKHLQGIIDRAILKVKDEKSFENLKNFFEAIVAYHRFYGGK